MTMIMVRQVTKPVHAVQFTGSNFTEVGELCPRAIPLDGVIAVPTMYQYTKARATDWIILEDSGEFVICEDRFFPMHYEKVTA